MNKIHFYYWVERLYSLPYKARIVERVAEAIIEELQDEYLKNPNTVSK